MVMLVNCPMLIAQNLIEIRYKLQIYIAADLARNYSAQKGKGGWPCATY